MLPGQVADGREDGLEPALVAVVVSKHQRVLDDQRLPGLQGPAGRRPEVRGGGGQQQVGVGAAQNLALAAPHEALEHRVAGLVHALGFSEHHVRHGLEQAAEQGFAARPRPVRSWPGQVIGKQHDGANGAIGGGALGTRVVWRKRTSPSGRSMRFSNTTASPPGWRARNTVPCVP